MEEKIKEIYKVMQGLKYFEWCQLKHAIDVTFNSQIREAQNEMTITDSELFRRELQQIPTLNRQQSE